MDLNLFLSISALTFVAELPDKTAFATLLLATRKRPLGVFCGAAAAFTVQSLVAVTFGSALTMLPEGVIQIGAGVLFLVFAFMMWVRKKEDREALNHVDSTEQEKFLNTTWSSFVVIFLAEWGDLTQLSTATLAAKYNSPITIFTSATLALWAVTALAILIGSRAKTLIPPYLLQRVAAIAFAVIALILLVSAYK